MITRIIKLDPDKLRGASNGDVSGAGGSVSNDAGGAGGVIRSVIDDASGACETVRLIREAAALLLAGRLVAFPTETVYGLGADAFNESALRAVYEIKKRPPDNPLIIHIENIGQLYSLASHVGDHAKILAEKFWPGPLTMVFKKHGDLPEYVTSGLDTVAVRMPSHPIARALIRVANTPIAAPSANPSGKPSPTNGAHVIHDLGGKIDMIIDSGSVPIGLESTVLDVTDVPAVILRPGAVTRGMIAGAIGSENVTQYPRDVYNCGGEKPLPESVHDGSHNEITHAGSECDRSQKERARLQSEHISSQSEDSRSQSEHIRSPDERTRPQGERTRPQGERTRPQGERTRSPGVNYKHYAPDARMFLFKGSAPRVAFWMKLFMGLLEIMHDPDADLRKTHKNGGDPARNVAVADAHSRKVTAAGARNAAVAGVLATDELMMILGPNALKNIKALSLGGADKPETAARRFYAALRDFDGAGIKRIYCELRGQGGIGTALTDRMTRAAGGNVVDTDEPLILFVCTGNTCRSAMAEALFNAETEKAVRMAGNHDGGTSQSGTTAREQAAYEQTAYEQAASVPRAISAGLYAVDGAEAAIEAVETLKGYYVDMSGHRARPLDHWLLMRSSLVLTMTEAHRDETLKKFPEASGRVFTLSDFTRKFPADMKILSLGDIDDPFGLGSEAYQECAARLYQIITPIAKKLTALAICQK